MRSGIAARGRRWLLVVLVAAGAWLGMPALAHAATYTVSAGLDEGNSSVCDLGGYFIDGFASPADSCTNSGIIVGSPTGGGWTVANGANTYYEIPAPAGLTIVRAGGSGIQTSGVGGSGQWGGGDFWQGSGGPGTYGGNTFTNITGNDDSGVIASPYYAVQIICSTSAGCTQGAYIEVLNLQLMVEDDQTPTLSAVGGSSNLWSQAGNWVWNDRSDPWSLALTGTDPSGVCSFSASVSGPAGSSALTGGSEAPNTAIWQQCAPWTWTQADGASVDTTAYAPTSGPLTLNIGDVNQAQTPNTQSETLNVDNVAPTLSITPLNDTDPSGNGDQQPAQLQITPTAGPSGISSVTCTVDGQSAPLTADAGALGSYLLTVPDDDAHSVSCLAQNNAVNPQGQHNSATAVYQVRAYVTSTVSFDKVLDPLVKRRVKERVLVGWHYAAKLNKHGKPIKVKVGGHYKTITVIKRVERCTTKRVKVAKHKYRLKKTCTAPKLTYTNRVTVGHGQKIKIYGELSTSQNVALAGQTVEILSTPKNGQGKTREIGTATTNATGGWSATIGAGPSRTITGYFPGADTVLPASGAAQITVPARIDLIASPHQLPWSGSVTLSGHLVGGYVPADGVAMRLLIKIPGRKALYEPKPFRTDSHGRFTFKWSFGTGTGVDHLHFAVALVSTESDYPFTANASPYIPITFGLATPPPAAAQHHKARSKARITPQGEVAPVVAHRRRNAENP